jgi:hypothetical protein
MVLKIVNKIKYLSINDLINIISIKRIKRYKPTPPNFKRILAKITDPKVGASTWAIGSQ